MNEQAPINNNLNENFINNVNSVNENNNSLNINNPIFQNFDMNNNQNENNALDDMEHEEELVRMNVPLISKLSPRDITEIVNDTIPSFIFIIFLALPFYHSPKYCDLNIYLSMKALIFIYMLFIFKALIKLGIIHFNKSSRISYKIFLSILNSLLSLCYYTCIYLSYIIYSNSENRCFKIDTFTIIMFFSVVFVGLISLFQIIINIIILSVYFFLMIETFINNPIYFYNHFGMDPEMIRNLPTNIADEKHMCTCVICLKDINEGDPILILNCPGKHYFHGDCIKSWLLVKTTCPMCRSQLIL